jgi:hypothetical protein
MKQKLLLFLAIAFSSATSLSAQSTWPKSVPTTDGGKLTMYQPQPESLNGNQLSGRAAVSVRKSESDEPVFGVVFFTATLQNSGSSDNAISSMRIKQAKFSGMEDNDLIDQYTSLLEKNSTGWNLGMSDNDIREAVDREKNTTSGADFNNAPPRIIYTDRPSTLIVLDGEPKIQHDKNIDAEKVVNSPNLIFKDGNQWNLYAGGNWYHSNSVTGDWQINNKLSSKVKKVNEAVKKQEKENNNGKKLTSSPKQTEIIVATEPTELLQTDGEPVYKNVANTSLLYVSNSPNEIFKDINSQRTYILIAGRWYSAANINGPWTYVPSDKLPEDFAEIPEGSDKDAVLANVAGTDAAEDAIVNAAVPQTAKVDKKTATIKVEYDGTPVFNPIEGTSLELAENSNVTVMIDADGRYFALDNGIWFVGQSAYGPWRVANDRPRDIDDIPANSPAYNSKYVYIYDDSPDYVYMGYTSGYLGSYYYGPTIVYGTGWHYRPWYRRMYYPRPITWGFGFLYDPWIGWSINWGWNFGYMYVGFYDSYYGYYGYPHYGYGYGGGWFGPYYYCPAYRSPYYGGYYGHYNYYGYNNGYYYNRNGYGYVGNNNYVTGNGSRTNRRPAAASPDNNNSGSGWTRNYNLYNIRRGGVVTQNLASTPRVYRPDEIRRTNANISTPLNSRYTNRLGTTSGNRTPEIRNNNSNSTIDNNTNNNPRINNPRKPVLSTPDRTFENGYDGTRPQRNELPRVNRNEQNNNGQREIPRVTRPEQITRPEATRPEVTRPEQNERPQVIRREVPRVTRPEPVQRNERPVQVERPERVQRPQPERSMRVERPNFDSRPQAPAHRESAPVRQPQIQRPSGGSSQGGNSSGGGIPRGRPAR